MSKKTVRRNVRMFKRTVIDALVLRGYRRRFSDVVILETTNACSLKCSCCPNGAASRSQLRPQGMMSKETFDLFMSQLNMPVKKCYLHMCGEPLLNKNIVYFASKLLERKITPVFFSNGYNADTALLDGLLKLKGLKVSFSMDLLSKKHYERLRVPGNYETAMASLGRINNVFSQNNRYYGLNIIAGPESLGGICHSCEELFGTFSHLNSISFSSLWPWPGLPQTGFLAGHTRRSPDICVRYRDLPVVLWNGDVSFCSFDYSGSLVIGNIYKEEYSHICNNSAARRIRRHLLSRQYKCQPFCNNCLLPRYQPFDITLLKNKFKKMTIEQRAEFETYISRYYEVQH